MRLLRGFVGRAAAAASGHATLARRRQRLLGVRLRLLLGDQLVALGGDLALFQIIFALKLRLLRTVAIYGPNASGKSTVLTAAQALRWLVADSSAQAKPDAKIPCYEPFLLAADSRTSPIQLGCEVIYKKSVLRYEITFKAKAIQTETLTRVDDTQESKLIVRHLSGEVSGQLLSQSKVNQLYVQEMQPNVAVLSKLAQHGPHKGKESVQPYYRAIRDALRYKDYCNAANVQISFGRMSDDKFADDAEYREWIMRHLIRSADIGISGVKTRRENVEIPDFVRAEIVKMVGEVELPDKRVIVSFEHEGTAPQLLDFANESAGTKKLFNLAHDWWLLANEPLTLFADELSASLHPRLLERLIRAVNEAPAERVPSQLIFTTHDTGLLEGQDGQPPALRRDQVYFTKKDTKGATELYSLTEFKEEARPVHNIRKRYLSGLYGAIPSVEKLSL